MMKKFDELIASLPDDDDVEDDEDELEET
jgi:hypothetical protein